MNRLIIAIVCACLLLGTAGIVIAQVKALPGESKTITATVEAISAPTRTLTLKGPKGNYVDIVVPANVERFSAIKVGDTLTAHYYENIVLRVQKAGEKPVDSAAAAVTPGGTAKPAGTASTQRTITATITAIDSAVPSITFSGPNNWSYSSRVEDKKALAQVKVGDKVDITWTEALLVSFDAPAKK
jgi:hypothetical protein